MTTTTPAPLAVAVSRLRHELCYNYYYGINARLAKERNDHRSQAFAYGQALQVLRNAFGQLPDTPIPNPALGYLPSGAENVTRQWLGTAANEILGTRA